MWRSLWRTIDRFSIQYFKYIIDELRRIKVVDKHNRELVVDILQSIVEIVTYGDRHDPLIFECFMEYQVLAEFVRVLKIGRNSRIEAPLLQYLSIMIQNMDSEHAIYYCLSNDYINSIISHQYEFDGGDLAPYYVSFLRAVSGKINRDTLCLLVKVQGDIVISFPLYSEAIKFAQHEEKMIQAAVRALTLNVFNVSDDMVYQFITTPPLSNYFSDLVQSLREKCFDLDALVHSTQEICIHEKKNELLVETDKLVDDLYYLKDILSVGESRLVISVTHNLLSLLVFPILLSLLQLRPSNGLNLSAVSSLYVVSRLLQVVGGKKLINSVGCVILYPYMISRTRDAAGGGTADTINHDNSFFNHLNEMEELVCPSPGSEGAENISRNFLFGHLADHTSSSVHFDSCSGDNVCMERSGILSCIFSNNHSLLLASIFLLVILAESKDLDYLLASLVGLNGMQETRTHDMSASEAADGSIFVSFMPQIFDALLRVLASQPPCSVIVQWHTGWFLQKLLVFYRKRLSDHNLNLFKTSYEQSRERLQKELDEYWFDYIPDTLRNEWASCKTALEESSQHRDPFFSLELVVYQKTTNGNTTYLAWQRMVDAVKAFVLHLQLKAYITKEDLLENPLGDFANGPSTDLGRSHVSDPSSASFGSEVVLGSGIPCKIAFPNLGIREIYIIPVAREISGKLLLAEKHPFRSQRGIVIAIAPLAGLSPKKDEDHPTWLHLQIREFDPRFDRLKTRDYHSKISNHAADGRWTLGFPNAEACEDARLLILTETCKQRSFVESMLAPLLKNNFLGQCVDL